MNIVGTGLNIGAGSVVLSWDIIARFLSDRKTIWFWSYAETKFELGTSYCKEAPLLTGAPKH